MSSQLIQVIALGLLILAAVFIYLRGGGKVTPAQLAQAAQMGVMAAEQYKSTGALKTNDEQLRFAIDFVKELLPEANAIPDSLIIDAIHAFVPAANAITAQIKEAWKDEPVTPKSPSIVIGDVSGQTVVPSPKPPIVGSMGLQ